MTAEGRIRREEGPDKVSDCDCPVRDGMIYHSRATCTDPLVAALGWYASDAEPPDGAS